jgi:hypothetical protein
MITSATGAYGFQGSSSKTKKALINRALRTSLDLRGLIFGGGGGIE